VLLTNCTIWVEGITDRRYIAHWLKLYQKHKEGQDEAGKSRFFKEDLHYSFVEYSGGNITHWSFLDETGTDVAKLCGKLFLIADADNTDKSEAKKLRHDKLAEKLEERFYKLPVREIENLLKPEVLKQILVAYGENPENLRKVTQNKYAKTYLGKFIEDRLFLKPKGKKRKGSYAAGSGTVSDKVKFCEHAIEAMQSWENVSEEAQKLTVAVYQFIEGAQQNRVQGGV
jgi:predicted house-cleaning noncanonical NTP pyrophosphatase (MazG superfamily)